MCAIYEKYEKIRNEKGLSDFKVAHDMGMSRSTLSEWKRKLHEPSLRNLAKLAKYFDVPVDAFMGDSE